MTYISAILRPAEYFCFVHNSFAICFPNRIDHHLCNGVHCLPLANIPTVAQNISTFGTDHWTKLRTLYAANTTTVST
uniref:Uncharacterized protein n=1 Tax=Magallana gigas TaxID=29159 RepID=K1QNH9_MAGGI